VGETNLDNLPTALYTATEVRELDRLAIEELGVPGIVLMRRAGRAVFEKIVCDHPQVETITIICGTGNNGGDGFIIATLAAQRKIPARVLLVGEQQNISGDAHLAFAAAQDAAVPIEPFSTQQIYPKGVLVDALLGTGLKGAVRPAHAAAIEAINNAALPVYAVDIPSGLCSDTGRVVGVAVNAAVTVSFIGLKRGLFTASGPSRCGEVLFSGLEVAEQVSARLVAKTELLAEPLTEPAFSKRPRDAHKGHYGHVLIVGGDEGMGGAALMAGEAALRCGAGLVSVATRKTHVAALLARRPELMVRGIDSMSELEPLLARATVVAVGPGLGINPWGEQLLYRIIRAELPIVVDADALNLLASHPDWIATAGSLQVLTPHPGEAARLLGTETATVQADRFSAIEALQLLCKGVVVLKGSGTLVTASEVDGPIGICPFGNPGMATGGMGDVLTGVIASLIAQGLSLADAAREGVCLHSLAADCAAEDHGERGLLATDLLPWLRRLVNGAKDPARPL